VEVLDRYLQAVSGFLPREQRADIVAELAEDLRSEIEERQAGLGRPLPEQEVIALLKRRGHPMTVAEAYLPPRHLIGPAMLPAYRRTVAIALGVLLAVAAGAYAVFSGPARAAAPSLSGIGIWAWLFVVGALAYVGLFTLIFAFVEHRYRRAQAAARWDPRDPEALGGDPASAALRSARAYAAAEVAVDLLVLWCWLGVRVPELPGLGIVTTPVWSVLHWPVAAYLLGSIAVGLCDALRPSSARPRLLAHLAVDGLALVLTGVLLAGSPWVQFTHPSLPPATVVLLERWINLSCLVTLLFIGVLCLARFVPQARRAFRPPPAPGVAATLP
jgi:hypothetical protein